MKATQNIAIQKLKTYIDSAEASIKSARKILIELQENSQQETSSIDVTSPYGFNAPQETKSGKVVEGIFNGERMAGSDGEEYPVPANYASKSKLVAGDHLKLTIPLDGRFIYKQIGPVPRKHLVATLVNENGQYKVLSEDKKYSVLLASVTYYKAQVGDKLTIIVPESEDTEWATIEAVLPKDSIELTIHEEIPEEEVEIDF